MGATHRGRRSERPPTSVEHTRQSLTHTTRGPPHRLTLDTPVIHRCVDTCRITEATYVSRDLHPSNLPHRILVHRCESGPNVATPPRFILSHRFALIHSPLLCRTIEQAKMDMDVDMDGSHNVSVSLNHRAYHQSPPTPFWNGECLTHRLSPSSSRTPTIASGPSLDRGWTPFQTALRRRLGIRGI